MNATRGFPPVLNVIEYIFFYGNLNKVDPDLTLKKTTLWGSAYAIKSGIGVHYKVII